MRSKVNKKEIIYDSISYFLENFEHQLENRTSQIISEKIATVIGIIRFAPYSRGEVFLPDGRLSPNTRAKIFNLSEFFDETKPETLKDNIDFVVREMEHYLNSVDDLDENITIEPSFIYADASINLRNTFLKVSYLPLMSPIPNKCFRGIKKDVPVVFVRLKTFLRFTRIDRRRAFDIEVGVIYSLEDAF